MTEGSLYSSWADRIGVVALRHCWASCSHRSGTFRALLLLPPAKAFRKAGEEQEVTLGRFLVPRGQSYHAELP